MIRKQISLFILSGCLLTLFYKTGYCSLLINDTIPFVSNYDPSKLQYCHIFKSGKVSGLISDAAIDEASGLVCGRRNKGILYTFNDHGNKNELYLITPNGKSLTTFYLDTFPDRDWESIAIDNRNNSAQPYIYIADIGDNQSQYKEVFIYRIVEPVISKIRDTTIRIQDVKKYVLTYPDGPHNAETFFIDPISKNWYIISKGEQAHVYSAQFPQSIRDTNYMKYLGVLPFSFLTDGDITFNGMELVLKNYTDIYYWKRENVKETIGQMLQRPPYKVPYIPEVHGESIGWNRDGSGFYTTSEKRGSKDPKIYFYEKRR